jgi:CoA:oxalate CoA-transferase
VPGPLGSRHPAAVPFQAFETLDGYIVVALISDSSEPWKIFCAAIGHPEISEDPRFFDAVQRLSKTQELGAHGHFGIWIAMM